MKISSLCDNPKGFHIVYRFAGIVAALVCAFAVPRIAHATGYVDETVKSSVVPNLNPGDTVLISSTNIVAVQVDPATTMTIDHATITQDQNSYAITLSAASGTVMMNGANVFFNGASTNGAVRFTNGYADVKDSLITTTRSKTTALWLNSSAEVFLRSSTISMTGGDTMIGISLSGGGPKLHFGDGNAIIINGTSGNWAIAASSVDLTFDGSTQYLPRMDVTGGGLMNISGASTVTFKGAAGSLSNSSVSGGGAGLSIADSSVVTFENANTGGHNIVLSGGNLIFKGASATKIATGTSSLVIGDSAVLDISQMSGIPGATWDNFQNTGTAVLGANELAFATGNVNGIFLGSGALTKYGTSADSMEFGNNLVKMSAGFTGDMNLTGGRWRFAGNNVGIFSTAGTFTQSGQSVLSLWGNRSSLAVGSGVIGSSGTLDISGLTLSGDGTQLGTYGDILLISAAGGINNAYQNDKLTVGGVSITSALGTTSTNSFLYYATVLRNGGKELWMTDVDLAWTTSNQAVAHGYFNVKTEYDLEYVLADRTDITSNTYGWDGKTMIKDGAGELIMHQKNTYSGTTIINQGQLRLGAEDAIASSGQVVMNGNATNVARLSLGFVNQTLQNLSASNAQNIIYLAPDVTKKVTLVNTMDTIFSGTIIMPPGYTGIMSASVLKAGPNKLTFTNAQAYTGTTWVQQGELSLIPGSAIFSSSYVVVDGTLSNQATQTYKNVSGASTGVIALGREVTVSQATGYTGTYAGVVVNGTFAGIVNSAFTKAGAGTLVLTGSSTYDWETRISSGTLALKDNGSITSSTSVNFQANTATLDISQSAGAQTMSTINGTGNGHVYLGAKDLNLKTASGTFSGSMTGSGKVFIDSPNTYTLSGNNTYTGTTTINSGTLSIGAGGATGSIVSDILNKSALVFNRTGTSTYAGSISGNGTLTKLATGTLTLSGSSSYSGGSTITGGRIIATNVDALGTGNVTNNSALELKLATTGTVTNRLLGTGTLEKTGAGTAVLTALNSTVGTAVVTEGVQSYAQNGAFNVTGNYTTSANATTKISGSSTLNVGNNLVQSTNSTLDITLGASNTPVITVTNNVALSGTLNISGFSGAVSGSASGLGDSKSTIIKAINGTISNDFDVKTSNASASGVDYITLSYGVSANSKEYQIGYALAWNDLDLTKAHGTFTIGSGSSFIVDVDLANRTGITNPAWDGKSLTKADGGLLVLSYVNSYTGTTTIAGGTLQTKVANAIAQTSDLVVNGVFDVFGTTQAAKNLAGSGTIMLGNGSLVVTQNTAKTFSGQITGASLGAFTKHGTETLTLTGNNTNIGTTIVSAGILQLGDGGTTGSYIAPITLAAGSGTLAFNRSDNYTHTGTIRGDGDVVQIGSGKTTLVSSATARNVNVNNGALEYAYNGTIGIANNHTTVASATTKLSGSSQLAIGGTLVQNAGAILDVTIGGSGTNIVATDATLGGTLQISGYSGALSGSSSGLAATRNVIISTTNAISGDFTSVNTSGAGSSVDYITLVAALAADLKSYGVGYSLTWDSGTSTGKGTFTLGSGSSFTVDTVLADKTGPFVSGWDGKSLVKEGAGTLILAAVNTYTGTTAINSGTLQLNVADAIKTSGTVVNDAALVLGANQTLKHYSGDTASITVLGSSTLTVDNTLTHSVYQGSITGAGGLVKTGAQDFALTGVNTYGGGTRIDGGILRATRVEALGGVTTASSTVTINGSGTLEFDLPLTESGTYAGTLLGTGFVSKAADGELTMSGNSSSWSGNAAIDGGVLSVTGIFGVGGTTTVQNNTTLKGTGTTNSVVVNSGGRIAPGNSPGILTIGGNLTLNNGAILDYELGAITNPSHTDQSATNDLLKVTGNVTLVGTSTLNVDMGSAAFIRGEYDLIKYNGTLTNSGSMVIGDVTGSAVVAGDKAQLSVDTARYASGADKWITLLYGLGSNYATWDGSASGNWTNTTVDGGNGNWYSPDDPTQSAYTSWVDSSGTPNGLWADGEFAIFRETAGTVNVVNNGYAIKFSGLQIRSSGYLIQGGTLATSGSLPVELRVDDTVTGTITTQITGSHTIKKTDKGTLVLGGDNSYTGGTIVDDGVLAMSNTGAISSGSVTINPTATLRVATGDIAFKNKLLGSGTLEIDQLAANNTFAFTVASTGTDFAGTAVLKKSTFTLENDALVNATLKLDADSTTNVADGEHLVKNLTINGGSMVFSYTGGLTAAGFVTTGTLDAISGTVSVAASSSSTTGLLAKPLLQQDEGQTIKLVGSTALSGTTLTLSGSTTTADVKNTSSVVTATATYNQSLAYANPDNASEKGLYISYTLSELGLVANQTTTLTDDTTPASAAELHAKISGAGNLDIKAVGTGTITLNNSNNSYTGTTTVSQGALLLGANNVLGSTSDLVVNAGAIVDVNGKTQTITKQTIVNGLFDARAADSAITTGTFMIGTVGTTGTAIFENNATLNAQSIQLGAGSGAKGTLLVGGSAVVTSANHLSSPPINSANGYISVYDQGTVSVGGRLSVGGAFNSTGSMSIADNGYVQYGSLEIGGASGAKGLVLIAQSGSLVGSSTSLAQIGAGNASASGTLNMSDSAFLQAGWLIVGQAGAGVLTARGNSSIISETASVGVVNAFGTPGSGTVALNDQAFWNTGTLTVGDAGNGFLTIKNSGSLNVAALMTVANAASGTGVVTIQDDALVSTGSIVFGSGSGTLNLNGGMLQTGQIDGSATGVLNFASGTLQATGSNANFIGGFTTGSGLNIAAGGAYIDTQGYAVGVNADSAFDGTGKLTKLGSGTLTLSASSSYSGGTDITEGTVIITHANALGGGTATIDEGTELRVTTGASTIFENALSGEGLFQVDLGNATREINFGATNAASTGANFSGTMRLASTTINFGTAVAYDNNAVALAHAMLELSNGGILRTNSETREIGGLNMDAGSVVHFDMNGIVPKEVLNTGTLMVHNDSKVAFTGFTGTAMSTSDLPKNFLDQDEAGENATMLIATGSLVTGDKMVELVQNDGVTPVIPAQVIDYGSAVATYNYVGVSVDDNKAHTANLVDGPGLYYDYLLTQLDVKSGQTLVLSSTDAQDTAKTLAVLVTGSGNVELEAGTGVIVLSHSNNYLGETTVTSGTAVAGNNSAFGHTSLITIENGAAMDLATYAQTGTSINVENGGLLNLNSGTLTIFAGGTISGNTALAGIDASQLITAGTLDVTGSNGSFAGSVSNSGTIRMTDVSALGDSGTLSSTAGALVRIDGAEGTLAKSLDGAGNLRLMNSATVTLDADSTTFSGTFDIGADTHLIASLDEQLGDANLSGVGTFEKIDVTTGITIDHANTGFSGTTIVTGGTLTLADLEGAGTGAMVNNADLVLATSGSYANELSGTGTTTIEGSVIAITSADNTGYSGAWKITSTGTVSINDNAQLGDEDASVDIATSGQLATSATTFEHALTGAGVLAVDSGTTFQFTGDKVAGGTTQFDGTVVLANSSMTLGEAKNTDVLITALVQLDAGSVLHANDEATKIAGLTFNGGALSINMEGTEPAEVLNVGTLSILDEAGSKLVFENYTGGTVSPADVTKSFLDQDELGDNATLLVKADTLTEAAPRRIDITNADGSALENGQVIDYGNVLATYNYAAQTTGSASAYTGAEGLYYDYMLTQLDVQDGQTLVLTTVNAQDNQLLANIVGLGSVTYTASGSSIILSGSNSYSGASTITSGTVIATRDHVLGDTSSLTIASTGAFDLSGNDQTVGNINTTAGSLISLGSGSFAIQNGGTIAGSLAGTSGGILNVSGGTLAITSANSGFAADTTIGSGATVRITNAAGLGSSAIGIDGTLLVDAATSGTLANTLSGSGLFSKTGAGTVTLVNSSTGFHGTGSIAAGRVTAKALDALGDAAIGISSGAVYEVSGVSGTLGNTLSGSGSFAVTNSTLAINKANTVINTTLAGSQVTLSHVSALSGTSGIVTMDQASKLIMGVNNVALGTLNMNGGALSFANVRDGAAITTLGNSNGVFNLTANLAGLHSGINTAGTVANYLTIGNAGTGTHSVFVETNNTLPSAVDTSIELISTGSGSANFVLSNKGGKLEYEVTTFELVKGDGTSTTPLANTWYLADRSLSHAADAILNTASTLSIDWAYSLDSLYLRMGEVRAENLPEAATGNVWIRTRGYRLNADNDLSGMSFHQYGWGITAGGDKAFPTSYGASLLGGFVDMGGIDREFDNHGNGDTHSIGAGAYYTMLSSNGWFADLVGKFDRYSNEFEARSLSGTLIRGEYTAKAAGLSVEGGKRFQRANGWWVEPTAQIAVLWVNGSNYSTQAADGMRAIKVDVADATNYQYRALVRFGRQFKDSNWYPYGKFAAVAVDSDGGEVTAQGRSFKADYDGRRLEFGFGTMYRINEYSQVYFDYEYAKAVNYDRPWSVNLGYRRLW